LNSDTADEVLSIPQSTYIRDELFGWKTDENIRCPTNQDEFAKTFDDLKRVPNNSEDLPIVQYASDEKVRGSDHPNDSRTTSGQQ